MNRNEIKNEIEVIDVLATCGAQTVMVRLSGYKRLTPKAAKAALAMAFGNAERGGVVTTTDDPALPPEQQPLHYGYRVYRGAHSVRKFYELPY